MLLLYIMYITRVSLISVNFCQQFWICFNSWRKDTRHLGAPLSSRRKNTCRQHFSGSFHFHLAGDTSIPMPQKSNEEGLYRLFRCDVTLQREQGKSPREKGDKGPLGLRLALLVGLPYSLTR
mmetsp:Transcript_33418/g.37496  ORF Transcript_33418/g.37496 Transcript_33418/m.37496 type:complete len:122 (-) Transcript_33418:373-738(-)